MNVTGSTIQQLDKERPNGAPKPRSECRRWRLWATTEQGRKSKRFNGTYSAAQDALSAFVAELEGFVPNSETFGAYAESWRLWREKSGEYSAGTCLDDAKTVRALRRTALNGMRMDEIAPEDCREALLWLKTHPLRRGGDVTNATMRTRHVALNSIFQQAEDDGKIASNPMRNIDPPKVDTREREALSPMEVALLLNRLDGMPLDGRVMALHLMLQLGLRRGEAVALLDSDIAGGFAHVHGSFSEAGGEITGTKSKAGTRTLPVPPRLQAKVDEWRAIRAKVGWADAPTLACNSIGGVLHPASLYRWWLDKRDGLGCEGMTLHQLRHSNLSMMARHMSPFDLQRYAGWSSIAPAMTYVHDDLDSVSRGVADAWESLGIQSNAPKTHQSAASDD